MRALATANQSKTGIESSIRQRTSVDKSKMGHMPLDERYEKGAFRTSFEPIITAPQSADSAAQKMRRSPRLDHRYA